MNNFTTTIIPRVLVRVRNKTTKEIEEKPLTDEAGRVLYKCVIREGNAFVAALNLPHAALVSLVQTAIRTVPAEDPSPPLVVQPTPRHA